MYRYSNYITNMPDLYVLQTLPVWPCLTHSIQPLQNYEGPRSLYPPIPQVLFPQVHALSLQCRSIYDYSTGKQRSLHLNHEFLHGGLLPPLLQIPSRFWYSWGMEGQWLSNCWILHFISFFFLFTDGRELAFQYHLWCLSKLSGKNKSFLLVSVLWFLRK